MRFLALLIIAVVFYQSVSFAKYNWDNGNRTAAAGALLMALLALVFPILTLLIKG